MTNPEIQQSPTSDYGEFIDRTIWPRIEQLKTSLTDQSEPKATYLSSVFAEPDDDGNPLAGLSAQMDPIEFSTLTVILESYPIDTITPEIIVKLHDLIVQMPEYTGRVAVEDYIAHYAKNYDAASSGRAYALRPMYLRADYWDIFEGFGHIDFERSGIDARSARAMQNAHSDWCESAIGVLLFEDDVPLAKMSFRVQPEQPDALLITEMQGITLAQPDGRRQGADTLQSLRWLRMMIAVGADVAKQAGYERIGVMSGENRRDLDPDRGWILSAAKRTYNGPARSEGMEQLEDDNFYREI